MESFGLCFDMGNRKECVGKNKRVVEEGEKEEYQGD